MGTTHDRVYEFDSFRLDTRQQTLSRHGRPVPLTPKAVRILCLLVERAGEVVDKRELLERVWEDTFVEEGTLAQNIFTLRRALGTGSRGLDFIETVPRRGYRFAARVSVAGGARRARRQLTFGRGSIQAARFAPDGRVVYGAAWGGGQLDLFATDGSGPDPDWLRFEGAGLLAVSSRGELAVSRNRRFLRGYVTAGELAVAPMAGGEARPVARGIHHADWSPDGTELAVVYDAGGRNRLEYPVGRLLFETGGWASHPRVSPGGDRVAFIHHLIPGDDSGAVVVVDRDGRATTLSEGWISAQGLAWHPAGDEVWFTATRSGNARAIHAVTLGGDERLIEQMTGSLVLHDVAPGNRVLVTRDDSRVGIQALLPGQAGEADLSWHDWSLARDLSDDGRTLLFTEAGEGGGDCYGVYVRRADGAPARRLGDGSALALSPDGAWALAKVRLPSPRLALIPLGGGDPVEIPHAGVSVHQWASWFPDGERILFAGNEPGRGPRLYVMAVAGGRPEAITDEGTYLSSPRAISPDGGRIAAVGPDEKACLLDARGGECVPLEPLAEGDVPVRWSGDGRSLFVRQRGEVPARVFTVDVATGRKRLRRELVPADPAGVHEILRILLTPDGSAYAYSYTRDLSTLFLLEGLE